MPNFKHAPRLRWRRQQQLLSAKPSLDLYCWLFDAASLTRRVQHACPGRFRVQVEAQGWARPRLDEAQALGLAPGRFALTREVHLLCDDRPWVFARTVIPVTTLQGAERRLAYLGSRPLGAVLFADPHMRRGAVEVAALRPGQSVYQAAVRGLRVKPKEIWGRRSLFWLTGKPLLVCEIFLPGIQACTPQPGQRRVRRP